MRWLLLLLLLCARQGEGATVDEYLIHTTPSRLAGLLLNQDSGTRMSMWTGLGNGDVLWRDPNLANDPGSTEHMRYRDGWLMLDAFDAFPADCIQAEVQDIDSGAVMSLTCRGGHYYAPWLLPRDPWRMRIWGRINGTRWFYWQGDFYPGEQVTDLCWYQGPQTREVIREQEVWWDSDGGWAFGSGTPPFDANHQPLHPTVTLGRETTLAKGEGVWTIKTPAYRVCAYSTWAW